MPSLPPFDGVPVPSYAGICVDGTPIRAIDDGSSSDAVGTSDIVVLLDGSFL
jgi:hypothetical protein